MEIKDPNNLGFDLWGRLNKSMHIHILLLI